MEKDKCEMCGGPLNKWGGTYTVTHSDISWFGPITRSFKICMPCWEMIKTIIREENRRKGV